MTKTKLILLISLISTVMYIAPAEAVICPSIADVYIDQRYPDENMNYKTRIIISYHPTYGIARGLFKFDIADNISASDVTAATIYLSGSIHTGGGDAINVSCYALNEPFTEGSDTWTSLSGGDFDNGISSSGAIPAGNDWETSFDVTALVTGNLAKLRNNGMLMKLQSESGDSYQNIASRESVDPEDFAPYLDIVIDSDHDGIVNTQDNCPLKPNGPELGSCTAGGSIGALCTIGGTNLIECGAAGFCSMNQEDTYPPQGNSCGDACECEGNFDDDPDVDGSDASTFKTDFGRSKISDPCTNAISCNGDFECDIDVDGTNATQFKRDFGRSKIVNPCPICPTATWCVY
jgi:hypothetical protein